jgi:hypothetical protein
VGGDDDNPLYYGRAVGKWNGQTLEVDTRGFNEDFWFTNGGLPHTDQLKLLEKFTRTDFDTLRYDVTIDDPGPILGPGQQAGRSAGSEQNCPCTFVRIIGRRSLGTINGGTR